jgi:hypothetical protein
MDNNFVNLYSSKAKGLSMSKSKVKNFFENLHSGFWMGDMKYKKFDPNDTYSLVKMAAFRRSVADFVYIVTGKHIPVRYNKITNDSLTTGKEIIISADFKNEEVDGIVGVALHEASHIVKSDMEYFKIKADEDNKLVYEGLVKYIPKRIFDEAEKKWNLSEIEVAKRIHRLLNWIEDRRIDKWQMNRAPGYRPYYSAMYKKYFYNSIIDLGLRSDMHRDESFRAYDFRIVNFLNKNTNLDALKGLREIWNTIDLKNINRLIRTKDSFEITLDVWDIIMKYMKNPTDKNQQQEVDGEPEDSNLDDGWEDSGDEASPPPQELSDEEFDKLLDKIENGETKVNKNGTPIKLTDEQRKKLEKVLDKQKDFLEGNINKGTPLNTEQDEQLNKVEKSGTSIEQSSVDSHNSLYSGAPEKVPVIVVRNLNELNISDVPMNKSYYGSNTVSSDAIDRGIIMGKQLAKKLIIRNESRKTVLTRKRTGRIDRRLLSGIGYGTDSIFKQRYVDQFGEALIHISVDASSSMNSSSKWGNALATCVAIAKAGELVKNFDVVISFRTSTHADNGGNIPYILIAYDSRKDSFAKIRNLFPKLAPANYTPEGLCFEAIMSEILQSMTGKDGLFINFSDGEPCLPDPAFSNVSSYGGEPAHRQTRSQVNKMLKHGIKVLSFFIDGNYSYSDFSGFKSAYGSGAKNIDIQSVPAVARAVNKMFTGNDKKFRRNI